MSAVIDNAVIGARDIESFHEETQKLIMITAGNVHYPESKIGNPDIIRLGMNLRRSEAIKEAANLILEGKPLFFSPIDFLMIIRDECLRPYHEETWLHLSRTLGIFWDICKLWQAGKFDAIMKALMQKAGLKTKIKFQPEEWLYLAWAHGLHDICKMAYKREFWDESGTFTDKQRACLHPHARWFDYLGEMFAVPRTVTALAVLHHYRNHGYPDNGVVKANQEFLEDPKFMFMLGLLTTDDVYEALSADRSYRKSLPHDVAMKIMPKELSSIESEHLVILEVLKQELFPHDRVIRPIEFCA